MRRNKHLLTKKLQKRIKKRLLPSIEHQDSQCCVNSASGSAGE